MDFLFLAPFDGFLVELPPSISLNDPFPPFPFPPLLGFFGLFGLLVAFGHVGSGDGLVINLLGR